MAAEYSRGPDCRHRPGTEGWTAALGASRRRSLVNDARKWRVAIADPAFGTADSDARFEWILKALVQRSEVRAPDIVRDHDGTAISRGQPWEGQGAAHYREPPYSLNSGDWLIVQLPEIYASFRRRADA